MKMKLLSIIMRDYKEWEARTEVCDWDLQDKHENTA